jgi:hypothetical protein
MHSAGPPARFGFPLPRRKPAFPPGVPPPRVPTAAPVLTPVVTWLSCPKGAGRAGAVLTSGVIILIPAGATPRACGPLLRFGLGSPQQGSLEVDEGEVHSPHYWRGYIGVGTATQTTWMRITWERHFSARANAQIRAFSEYPEKSTRTTIVRISTNFLGYEPVCSVGKSSARSPAPRSVECPHFCSRWPVFLLAARKNRARWCYRDGGSSPVRALH